MLRHTLWERRGFVIKLLVVGLAQYARLHRLTTARLLFDWTFCWILDGAMFQWVRFLDVYVEIVGVLDSIMNKSVVARCSCAFSFGVPLTVYCFGHHTALRVEMDINVST